MDSQLPKNAIIDLQEQMKDLKLLSAVQWMALPKGLIRNDISEYAEWQIKHSPSHSSKIILYHK